MQHLHVSCTRCCSLEHTIWACTQCATPTRTMSLSHTAHSDVQSEEPAPAQRNLSFTKNNCCVSANPAHRWDLAGHAWGITLTAQEQKNCLAHNHPKTAGSSSQRLKRRHTEKLGSGSKRDRSRLQKTGCREEFIPAVSLCTQMHLTQLWSLSPQILHTSRMGGPHLSAWAVLKS